MSAILFATVDTIAQTKSDKDSIQFLNRYGVSGKYITADNFREMGQNIDPFLSRFFPALIVTSIKGDADSRVPFLDVNHFMNMNGEFDFDKDVAEMKRQLSNPKIIQSRWIILHDQLYREKTKELLSEGFGFAISLGACNNRSGVTMGSHAFDMAAISKFAGHSSTYKGVVFLNACGDFESLLHESYHLYQYSGMHGVQRAIDVLHASKENEAQLGITDNSILSEVNLSFAEMEACRYAIQTSLKIARKTEFNLLPIDHKEKNPIFIVKELMNINRHNGRQFQTELLQQHQGMYRYLVEKNSTLGVDQALRAVDLFFEKYALPKK